MICQQGKTTIDCLTYIVANKPRSSISFNLCHWTKSTLSGGRDKIKINKDAQGIL
tara:strand:+ start:1713 stop:1877 length:165 start_codon:yes stop_codon:yes gene_type:complete